MSFPWIHYLRLAEELVEEASTQPSLAEAKLRSAISRAYYAGHTLAREYLIEKENLYIERTGTSHQRVIDEFDSYNDARRQVAMNLKRLRVDRNKVDYRNALDFKLPEQAKLDLKQASRIVDLLKSYMEIPGLAPGGPNPT